MCIAYGWNFIGGYTGYAAFGNVAYLGLGAFVAAGFMSRQPGHLAWPWFVGIPLAVVIVVAGGGLHRAGRAAPARPLLLHRHARHRGRDAADHQRRKRSSARDGLFPNFFGGGLPLNFPLARGRRPSAGSTLDADRLLLLPGPGHRADRLGLTRRLSRSKFGYGLVAIRENEEAAEVMGVNTTLAQGAGVHAQRGAGGARRRGASATS